MFRVVYPAAVSIDANDFNEAFKNAIKRQQFFNVEQMIIMDQLNQYRRANIMYSDMGGGKKKASIKHQSVPYSTVAPFIGVTVGADGKVQPAMSMSMGPGLPNLMFPLGSQTKDDAATPATGTPATGAAAATPASTGPKVIIGPGGTFMQPANGVSMQASMLIPGSNQLVGVNPALPVGTDGKPYIGMGMPFGVGGVPLMRPGLVPGSGSPLGFMPGMGMPMGRVW